MSGTGGGTAGGGSPGSGGTTGGGTCVKGQTKGSEVLVIGDSFIALNRSITTEIQAKARAAGALAQNETYRDKSVSGTTLGNNQIPSQYTNNVSASNPVKVVLMDGGGNDCLLKNDPSTPVDVLKSFFPTMAQNNTQYVVYFFYPDPVNNNTLRSCLDQIRPQAKSICEGLTSPKCYFIDLRSMWAGHSDYVQSDGIHPTEKGGAAVGDVVWQTMVDHCIAQ